jgi:hypothetical protein
LLWLRQKAPKSIFWRIGFEKLLIATFTMGII